MENTHDISDCPCEAATIYLDRAEVRRRVKLSVKQGDNEIKFNNLSDFIDEDSVRVEGTGQAVITEVSFQNRLITPQEQEELQSRNKDLQEKIDELVENEKGILSNIKRLQKQRVVLDGFADSVMRPSAGNGPDDPGSKTLLNKDVISGMGEFFDLYGNKASTLDQEIQKAQKEQVTCRNEMTALRQRMHQRSVQDGPRSTRHLSVLLDAKEEGEVTLFVTYLVSNASWSPKYDIRVFSEEKKMKIQYHGVIRQGTGEDWNEVKLSLSSAMPNVGGQVPKLGTQKISLKPKYPTQPMPMARAAPMMMMKRSNAAPAMMEVADSAAFAADAIMAVPQATVREGITSAVYEIARPATIPSDNTEHKVTVALIDLAPQFHYACVPCKSTYAYLKAKVTNTSPYAMLAGPSNIFLDNNFIAKGNLEAVSPGEEFECSCGVDPAIKISYKALEKHRSNTGWMSKSKVTSYKQVIELRNTHQEPIHIKVLEHLPMSTESSVKVHLQEPNLPKEKHEGPVQQTKDHNLEWNLDMASSAATELVLKYTIEVPEKEDIEYHEEFSNES